MTATIFSYWIAEGVQDVAFIGKLLSVFYGAKRIRLLSELPEFHKQWVSSFRWPSAAGQIDQPGVPVPWFYRLASDEIVVLRNAEGVTKIHATLDADFERFDREGNTPRSIVLFVDCDDKPADKLHAELDKEVFKKLSTSMAIPSGWGVINGATPAVGLFSFPEAGLTGTLEDLLLALGDDSYPELSASARQYAKDWHTRATTMTGKEWKPIAKPAGEKKAAVAAMVAVLKPGYAAQNSIEQNSWLQERSSTVVKLKPLLQFIAEVLALPIPGAVAKPDATTE